jgi:hypothetical protein
MPSYDDYLMRHSEHMVMWLIEEAERANGIQYSDLPPLEERWDVAFGIGGGNDFNGAPAMRLAA